MTKWTEFIWLWPHDLRPIDGTFFLAELVDNHVNIRRREVCHLRSLRPHSCHSKHLLNIPKCSYISVPDNFPGNALFTNKCARSSAKKSIYWIYSSPIAMWKSPGNFPRWVEGWAKSKWGTSEISYHLWEAEKKVISSIFLQWAPFFERGKHRIETPLERLCNLSGVHFARVPLPPPSPGYSPSVSREIFLWWQFSSPVVGTSVCELISSPFHSASSSHCQFPLRVVRVAICKTRSSLLPCIWDWVSRFEGLGFVLNRLHGKGHFSHMIFFLCTEHCNYYQST